MHIVLIKDKILMFFMDNEKTRIKDSNLKIKVEDLNSRSIFINWSDKERLDLFSKLLRKINLSNFSKMIHYDRPTICENHLVMFTCHS